MRPELIVVGRVAGAHGLRGHLRVRWLGDGPEHLARAEVVWLARDEGDPAPRRHLVRSVAAAGGTGLRLELAGLHDRGQAEERKGQLVLVEAAAIEPLSEDEFYWHQLVGCRVEASDGSQIGVVRELMETGAHDVLIIDAPDGRQHLVPTAREFVTEIDLAARRIRVAVIPGLLDPD